MDKDIQLVLIGSLAGGGFALMTAIIAACVQYRDSERKRQWALDDRKKETQKIILEERLQQSEKYILSTFKWAKTLFIGVSRYQKQNNKLEPFISLSQSYFDISHFGPIAKSINNEEFNKLADEYEKILSSLIEALLEITINFKSQPEEFEIIMGLSTEIEPIVVKLIRMIDNIRAKAVEN